MVSASNAAAIYPVSNGPLPKKIGENLKEKHNDTCSEASSIVGSDSTTTTNKLDPFRWFPSYRMMTAAMLCLCFASVHMMNSNMGMAMVCMVEETQPTSLTTSSPLSVVGLTSTIATTLSRKRQLNENLTTTALRKSLLPTTIIPTSININNPEENSSKTTANSAVLNITSATSLSFLAGNKPKNKSLNGAIHYEHINKTTLEPQNALHLTTLHSTEIPKNNLDVESLKHSSQASTLDYLTILVKTAPKVRWSAEDQGWIFGAFNAGLLCMLVTGFMADKFNAKYMIIVSVILASAANIMIPLLAYDVRYVMGARFLVGLAEALLQPAINSLVTRWFPSSERSYALGLATGGRQIDVSLLPQNNFTIVLGTLLIVPTAGALCSQTVFFGGWPSIFYVSALTGLFFVFIYILVGADKPSKQQCISNGELRFITIANTSENMGKKRMERKVPWKSILTSAPVWSALISVVCHEFPLMTMIMFLPSYLHDVHHYEATKNGILSAIPTACLWVSKIGSSYLNTWLQEKTDWQTSSISKILNGVGSVGLALFMVGTTFLDASRAGLAVVFLCFSMLFTGMHTPGCQAALVAVAPAFSGAITGLTFFFVAICGMINPAMTKWIVVTGSQTEWNIVFYISTIIALIPVVVFSVCGSADVQEWAAAARSPQMLATVSCPTFSTIIFDDIPTIKPTKEDKASQYEIVEEIRQNEFQPPRLIINNHKLGTAET